MRIIMAAALAGALFGSGCATVTRGSSQAWTVQTEPVGAEVRLSSGETCKTPCTLKKRRKHAFTVDISLDGYQPVKTDVVSSISGKGGLGLAGNALIGGLIGLGVDAGTGAARDLTPNPLVVKLEPVVVTAPAAVAVAQAGGADVGVAAQHAGVAPQPGTASAAQPAAAPAQACESCKRIGDSF